MYITARRLRRLEIWTALQCAGGVRQIFVPKIEDCVADLFLAGNSTVLTVDLPRTMDGAAELLEHRVIRIWEDDARWDEWRLARRSQAPDDGRIRLTGTPTESFLGIRPSPIGQLTGGVRYYNVDLVGLKPSEIIDQWVLPGLAADGINWLARGNIDQDVAIELTLDWNSPLQLLQMIADRLTLELQFRRNGVVGYYVDLVNTIGAAAGTVDVRYAKNLATHVFDRTTDGQATRVFPRGAKDTDVHATIARAVWSVNTVVGAVITLVDPIGGDGPIAFDGQLVGACLRKADGSLTLITASSAAAQSITVASAAGVAAGDLVQLRANVGGDDLTWLDSPADQAISGIVSGWPDFPDIPGTNNVIPNPAARTWPGALPTGWTSIGAPVVTKQLVAPKIRTAPQSIKVVAGSGEGVRSPAGKIFPTALYPQGAGMASVWVESGIIRVELELTTGAGTKILPIAPAVASEALLGQWVDVGITEEDLNALGATAIAIRVLAHGGPATFYVDRVQATESSAQLPFVEGSGGTRLWQGGNEALRLRGAPIGTFTVTMADLARMDPVKYPYDSIPELGAAVNVTDGRVNGGTGGSRIVGLQIRYLEPGRTGITVSNRPEDLTGVLTRAKSAARLSPQVSEPNFDAGPTLDVNTTPGATNFTVNYAVTADLFEYSIDGGAFGAVPATGFTVSRPAAGANDRILEFRATKNDQLISNTITIPAIDKDTVTPDLSVVHTAQDATTTSFQATASNPGGGAAPTITLTFVNCTGVGYGGAGPFTIASGTTVQVNRAAFGSNQGSVKFRAAIASAGAEEISRTVPNQDGPGPSLDVRATPGSSNFTITYTVTATTFEYSIDGAAYAAVPGSGFTVSRPAAGANDKTLSFRAIKDSQTVVDTVIVPAIDKDTVTPDISVVQTAQAATTTSFQVTGSNPGGGSAPTITVEFVNCTGVGYAGGGPHTIASGTTVVVNRPAFQANQATVKFRGTISSAGAEEISRTVPNQDATGPSLDVVAVPGSTSYTINYTVTATTFEYSTDGGSYTSVPSSGFTVSRNAAGGSAKSLTFRATQEGQTISSVVEVPAQESSGAGTAAITSITTLADLAGDQLTVSWTTANVPAAAKFYLHYKITAGGSAEGDQNDISSPYTFNVALDSGAAGRLSLTAKLDGIPIAVGNYSGVFPT